MYRPPAAITASHQSTPEYIAQYVCSDGLRYFLDCSEDFMGTLELTPLELLFQVSKAEKVERCQIRRTGRMQHESDFLVRQKSMNDVSLMTPRTVGVNFQFLFRHWDKHVSYWGEDIIGGASGAECFSLWQSTEYVKVIRVFHNGQDHFDAV
jgi:hypothetical protein